MVVLGEYERGSTFKSVETYKSGSTYVDPSGNIAFITMYDPDGNVIIDNSGQRASTGVYYYYVSTQTDSPLGLYRIRWRAYWNFGSPWNYAPKDDTEAVSIVSVE